jgi:zinc transporter ZupT
VGGAIGLGVNEGVGEGCEVDVAVGLGDGVGESVMVGVAVGNISAGLAKTIPVASSDMMTKAIARPANRYLISEDMDGILVEERRLGIFQFKHKQHCP